MARAPSYNSNQAKPAWPQRAIRWFFKPPRRCPHCRSREIRYSHCRTYLDSALGYILLAPFRCLDCRARFFRPSLPRPRQETSGKPGPLIADARNEAMEPVVPLSRLPERSPSILVLDKDPALRKLLCRLLERSGYAVTELAGVEELELRPGKIDVLIADLGALQPQDAEIVRQLADLHPGVQIVHLCSQPVDDAAAASSLVLPKPFHADELLGMVQQALGAAARRDISQNGAAPKSIRL
jgi:CheY-like chemotaxis protein